MMTEMIVMIETIMMTEMMRMAAMIMMMTNKTNGQPNCNDSNDNKTCHLVQECCTCVLSFHFHTNTQRHIAVQCNALAPNGIALHLKWRWLVTMFAISSKQ